MKGVIKRILSDHIEGYFTSEKSVQLKQRPQLFKLIKKMTFCGSLWLGVNEYSCTCGKHKKYIPVPCKSKVCLKCSFVYRLRQTINVLFKSLNSDYFFITFTIPHSLHFIFEDNRKEYLTAFNQAITATFLAYIKKRKINCLPGIISVPHTFGSMLQLHVHFHVLVTCGGVHKDTGEWRNINHYPIEFLKKTFRAKFIAKLRSLYKHNRLKFKDKKMNIYKHYNSVLRKAYGFKKAWYTHISCKDKKNKHVFQDGDVIGSLAYALRYLHRLPISEYNIVGYDGKYVTWLPKRNKFEEERSWKIHRKIKTPVYEFIEKLLIHIPDKNERTLYYSGLYSPYQKNRLYAKGKEHFNNKTIIPILKKDNKPYLFNWAELRKWHSHDQEYRTDPSLCPFCGNHLVMISRLTFNEAMCRSHTVKNNQIVSLYDSS